MYFYSDEPEINYMSRTLATSDVASANLLAASRAGFGYEVLNIGPDIPFKRFWPVTRIE